jgi:hypothetical protein
VSCLLVLVLLLLLLLVLVLVLVLLLSLLPCRLTCTPRLKSRLVVCTTSWNTLRCVHAAVDRRVVHKSRHNSGHDKADDDVGYGAHLAAPFRFFPPF